MQDYSSDNVARHNTSQDLWMTIHGNVFDLSKFLTEHPGGEEVLINLAGQDGTKCFDDIGHSQEAIQLRDTFLIGRLNDDGTGATTPAPQTETIANPSIDDDDDWHYEETKTENSSHFSLFVGVGVVLYALIFYYIFY